MGIDIGQKIKKILNENAEVTAIVSNRIFPLVYQIDSRTPCVIFRRTGMVVGGTKDRHTYDPTVEILCVTDTYPESVDLAKAVLSVLDGYRDSEDIDIIRFSGGEEYFQDEKFVQSLVFEISQY